MSRFAPMPDPPYFAVIFSNQLADAPTGYSAEQPVGASASWLEKITAKQGGSGMGAKRDIVVLLFDVIRNAEQENIKENFVPIAIIQPRF